MGFFWTIGNSNYGNSWEQQLQQLELGNPKSFKFLFFLHQKNTNVANSKQNHYGCKAVSTSVASLFPLKWQASAFLKAK